MFEKWLCSSLMVIFPLCFPTVAVACLGEFKMVEKRLQLVRNSVGTVEIKKIKKKGKLGDLYNIPLFYFSWKKGEMGFVQTACR